MTDLPTHPQNMDLRKIKMILSNANNKATLYHHVAYKQAVNNGMSFYIEPVFDVLEGLADI